jgi:hypothetical protein
MTVILNLDELIPEDKFVKWKGKDHLLDASSTETYLKILGARKKLVAVREDDEEAQVEFALKMIVLALPTIPRDELIRLSPKAIMRLVDVIQKEMELDGEEGTGQPAAPGEAILAELLPA